MWVIPTNRTMVPTKLKINLSIAIWWAIVQVKPWDHQNYITSNLRFIPFIHRGTFPVQINLQTWSMLFTRGIMQIQRKYLFSTKNCESRIKTTMSNYLITEDFKVVLCNRNYGKVRWNIMTYKNYEHHSFSLGSKISMATMHILNWTDGWRMEPRA